MARKGAFEGLTAAMMVHPADAELVRDRFERTLAQRGREGEVWHLDLPEV